MFVAPQSISGPALGSHVEGARVRLSVVGLISFLTLVDLFAAQAILPQLAAAFGATPAQMGTAVNASTFGMAGAGVLVALLGRHIDRRRGIWMSLALLAIPTTLLATTRDLGAFTALRVAQGVLMASAFTLTMAYLSEHCAPGEVTRALAAYVTGNVASNLFGRMLSAAVADHFGLSINFLAFAALNLAGAALVYVSLERSMPMPMPRAEGMSRWLGAVAVIVRDRRMRAAMAIGFIVLFAFIGVFTYVNFVLVRPPLALSPMSVGLVYLVFLPSIAITPMAARFAQRLGFAKAMRAGFLIALAGLPLAAAAQLEAVLAGLVSIAVGTFLAQALATGYVSRLALGDRASASGLYLASYYVGGLVGSALLGVIFDAFGWRACLAVIGLALVLALLLVSRLEPVPRHERGRSGPGA
jgi:MFS transporter, YNFM family, putative membrane transport protein